jgi:hypothetical protein
MLVHILFKYTNKVNAIVYKLKKDVADEFGGSLQVVAKLF